MKIGIDLDGVVFDSEQLYRVYEEIYATDELKNNKIINREEPKYQTRYNWNKEQREGYNKKYIRRVCHESNFMPGFKEVYNKLKELGYKMIVITARGMFFEEMIDDTMKILKDNNIEYDNYYFNIQDKTDICLKENIDIMIDDDYHVIEKLINNNIKTLYFRDAGLKKLDESAYLHEVNNWGDIYRYFREL